MRITGATPAAYGLVIAVGSDRRNSRSFAESEKWTLFAERYGKRNKFGKMSIKTTLAIQVPIAAGVFHGGLFGDGNGTVWI